jgi:hypothetical protein
MLQNPTAWSTMMATAQTISPRTRRSLSADALFALLRRRFESVQDQRAETQLTYPHLFDQVVDAGDDSRLPCVRTPKLDKKGCYRETQWATQLPLNKSNPDLRVGYVGQSEMTAEGGIKSMFSWVTVHCPLSVR